MGLRTPYVWFIFPNCHLLVEKKQQHILTIWLDSPWKKKEWNLLSFPLHDDKKWKRAKYRMTSWGKERTEMISSVWHTLTGQHWQELQLGKTHRVKQSQRVSMNTFSTVPAITDSPVSPCNYMFITIYYALQHWSKMKKCVLKKSLIWLYAFRSLR